MGHGTCTNHIFTCLMLAVGCEGGDCRARESLGLVTAARWPCAVRGPGGSLTPVMQYTPDTVAVEMQGLVPVMQYTSRYR